LMNVHWQGLDSVVGIAESIPEGRCGLCIASSIEGAALEGRWAEHGRLPEIFPLAPGIARWLTSKLSQMPCGTAICAHLYRGYRRCAGPCQPAEHGSASGERGSRRRSGKERANTHRREWDRARRARLKAGEYIAFDLVEALKWVYSCLDTRPPFD